MPTQNKILGYRHATISIVFVLKRFKQIYTLNKHTIFCFCYILTPTTYNTCANSCALASIYVFLFGKKN